MPVSITLTLMPTLSILVILVLILAAKLLREIIAIRHINPQADKLAYNHQYFSFPRQQLLSPQPSILRRDQPQFQPRYLPAPQMPPLPLQPERPILNLEDGIDITNRTEETLSNLISLYHNKIVWRKIRNKNFYRFFSIFTFFYIN